ncbi:mpv17-like protein [Lineus longissimus]|uniref:mpv17-like protein n=1 Tax=Lineus longissimus TaxID=88925 RepID=UPI002B4CCE6B
MFSKFRKVFHAYPLLSNMAIVAGLYCAGDVTQRTVMRVDYDWRATARIATISCVSCPASFYFYKALDKYLPGRSLRVVMLKVTIDGLVMTPPLLAAFFIGNSILEGQEDIFAECKEKALTAYIADIFFWLPVQTANFFLIPPHLRVVYMSFAALGWSTILCFIKGRPVLSEEVPVET